MTARLPPEECMPRPFRGRIGAAVQQSRHDPKEYTLAARSGFLGRFWPDDPTLPPEEAERRAQAGLKAHMLKLAYASVRARRRRGASRNGGAQ